MTSLLQCPATVSPGTTVYITDVPDFAGAQPTGAGYFVDANRCITVEDEEHAARLVRDLGYVARADADVSADSADSGASARTKGRK